MGVGSWRRCYWGSTTLTSTICLTSISGYLNADSIMDRNAGLEVDTFGG